MDHQQVTYLLQREAQEREAVNLSEDETAAKVHREMAERYAELAHRVFGDLGQTPEAGHP